LWNHIKTHKSEESPEFLTKMLREPSEKVRNNYEEENNLDSVLSKCSALDIKADKPHNWYLSRPKFVAFFSSQFALWQQTYKTPEGLR